MKLSELLVSYNQLNNPIITSETKKTPEQNFSKYQRMIQYLDNQKFNKSNNQENVQNKGFTGWNYTPSDNLDIVNKSNTSKSNFSQNRNNFEQAYNNVEKNNKDAAKYRAFLTQVAERESSFNQKIQNLSGAPAWGYFQFMQSDDNKYNNIKHYANTDIQTFLNNPELQIEAAIKLVKDFENSITKIDKIKAKAKGLNLDTEKGKNAALHAMWLAGPGGFRKWLNGKNLSDKHWSKTGKGISVNDLIKKYNI